MADPSLVKALAKFTKDVEQARVGTTGVGARSAAAVAIEVSSDFMLTAAAKDRDETSESEGSREIFDWIEQIVGSSFIEKGQSFKLLEFEMGKDEPNEEDLLRHSLGEPMVIPLRVVYMLEGESGKNKELVVRLPSYFYDFADEVSSEKDEPKTVTVFTHETYFYSVVVPDVKNFMEAEGVKLTLPIPECYYVKHCSRYEARRTPALIENVMKARTMLVLSDPKGEGFNEVETIEAVEVAESLAVMNEMGKLHAVTWCMQERRSSIGSSSPTAGRNLKDLWPGLLSVTDQAAIHDQVLDGFFEFLTTLEEGEEEMEKKNSTEKESINKLYERVCYSRPEIERTVKEALYSEGPAVPTALLHTMIGGPNLYFRRKKNQNSSRSSSRTRGGSQSKDALVDCCITNWGLATTGNPILDLALFTTLTLTSTLRQQYTDNLLEHYWQAFVATASLFNMVPTVDIDYIGREYEKFQLWAFIFMIAACEKEEDMSTEEIRDVLENIIKILDKLHPRTHQSDQ